MANETVLHIDCLPATPPKTIGEALPSMGETFKIWRNSGFSKVSLSCLFSSAQVQLTTPELRANTVLFREWCRTRFAEVPDFEADPDAMLSDPWEGLGPVWYWDHAGLSRYADENDPEMITRRINGGLNGYQDRLHWYARAALVLLGYAPEAVREFQRASALTIDGISGPRTRAALHSALRQRPELGAAPTPPSLLSSPQSPPAPHPAEAVLDRIAAVISEHRGA